MIAQLNGKLIEVYPTHAIIDCQGVGYFTNISLQTYSKINHSESVKLFTYQIFREDGQYLYGFFDRFEREVFIQLISVSGIGASIARTMLSSLEAKSIVNAIVSNDVSTIQSIKGIGLKTAQRTIVELKDKMLKLYDLDEVTTIKDNTTKNEALSALEVLGFNKKLAEKAIDKLLTEDPSMSVEVMIKKALKNL